jgi:hypothetical protein
MGQTQSVQDKGQVSDESGAMLPRQEIDILTMTATQAVELAKEGHLSDGYSALLAGFERAQEIASVGEVWGEELLSRWRGVCLNYAKLYGLSLE